MEKHDVASLASTNWVTLKYVRQRLGIVMQLSQLLRGVVALTVAGVGGCSLAFATAGSGSDASPGDGVDAAVDGTSNNSDADVPGDVVLPDGAVTEDGAASTFCGRAPHSVCEDFDDPNVTFPGRWAIGTQSGGTVTLDTTTASRTAKFSIPATSGTAKATLKLQPGLVMERGTFAMDIKFSEAPKDNLNLMGVEFPIGSKDYELAWLVKPSQITLFEESSDSEVFTEFPFRSSIPSDWHRFALTFDVEGKTCSASFDGVPTQSNTISSLFGPANATLKLGIAFSRANAGPLTIWVDNVTLDLL